MHDTLSYFQSDPIYRQYKQDVLTFAMMYEYSERFIMPLSHDEVVHLKRSLLGKMPGDEWQQFANLRTLIGYQYTRPGKKLVFMGTELAVPGEWNHDVSLDWHLADVGLHGAFRYYYEQLGHVYRSLAPLWELDATWRGFQWIDVNDRQNSVISFVRCSEHEHAVVVLNLTPVPRDAYRIGAPSDCRYQVVLNSDDARYGGSGYPLAEAVQADKVPFHGFEASLRLNLPPLSIVVLVPEKSARLLGAPEAGAHDVPTPGGVPDVRPAPSPADPAARPSGGTA
jgi:1,4-alpha-glucan branching enzyme